MRPENTVLLIGASVGVLRRAKAFGLDVISFQHPSKYTREQADLADMTFIADFTDWSVAGPVAKAAYETWRFSAALSLTDPGVLTAARINDRYGLGGTGLDVCRRFTDKSLMRRLMAEAGGATAVGAQPLVDRASLESFAERYGYPVIVKPTDAAASLGVLRVDGPDGVDDALAQVADLRGSSKGCGGLLTIGDFLLEEYVDGPEFSVEAFSFAGRHVVVAITEKLTSEAHFAELGHTVPARVDDDVAAEIVAATERFLDVMGLADGPSHTEFRLGQRGPMVIESHNRVGGDRIDELVAAAYGVDLVSYAVGWPFGLVEELPARPRPAGAACLRVVPSEPGTVTAVSGVDEVRAHPDTFIVDVGVEVGDVIPELRDNHDRVGMVAVTGPDSDRAVKLCDELVGDTLRIQVASP